MLWIWINPVGLGRRKISCWPGRDAIRQFDNWTWGVIGCYSAIDNLLLIEFIYQGSSVCLVVLGCARPQPDIDMPCNAIEGSRCISFSSSFSGSSDCDEECGINSRGDFEILRWVFESAPPYSVLLSFWLRDFDWGTLNDSWFCFVIMCRNTSSAPKHFFELEVVRLPRTKTFLQQPSRFSAGMDSLVQLLSGRGVINWNDGSVNSNVLWACMPIEPSIWYSKGVCCRLGRSIQFNYLIFRLEMTEWFNLVGPCLEQF